MITGFYIMCRCCRKYFAYIDQWAFKGVTYSTPAKDRVNFTKDIENAHVYDLITDAKEALKNTFNNRNNFYIADSFGNKVFEPG